MAKKPLTTFDKVCRCIEGITNEEAEEIAAKILAQVAAKRIYIERIDHEAVFFGILKKIVNETDEYRKNNSGALAFGRAYHKNQSATNSPQPTEV